MRSTAGERVWGAAVRLVRTGAVQGVSASTDEVHLKVRGRHSPNPHDVFLYPVDVEWDCDCDLQASPCLHACAGAIAFHEGAKQGEALPEPVQAVHCGVRYDFVREEGRALSVHRVLIYADGREEPVRGPLLESEVILPRQDHHADRLLSGVRVGPLAGETLRKLLVFLEGQGQATLDGRPVSLSADPVFFRIAVVDEGVNFVARLVSPPGYELVRGGAIRDGVLAPTSHGRLSGEDRRKYLKGARIEPDQVRRWVRERLPLIRDQIPVEVLTNRLPEEKHLLPQVELALAEVPAGLEVRARAVYGDPVIARVEQGELKLLGDIQAARDLGAENTLSQKLDQDIGLKLNMTRVLPPHEAAAFLARRLPRFSGRVEGSVDPNRFEVIREMPSFDMAVDSREDGDIDLDLLFITESGRRARPADVLAGWSERRALVPLMEGGYAPMPSAWLEEHGLVLKELIEARRDDGSVPRQNLLSVLDLASEQDAPVPPDLERLHAVLAGEDGVDEREAPEGMIAELRPYQKVGLGWLAFWREVDHQGILADDMGLGKTIQAIGAMLEAGGRSLVVAPTSVLANWKRECERFAPGLKVSLYHGPSRSLEEDADVVLTSYTLLRMDVGELSQEAWSYVVLDEAQAIKNARSQTARAARQLPAKYRLCLSGTPVENRLEELWSLFHFLMPGYLGSLATFRERFSRPIEAGEQSAAEALRKRIRPYVLRRLKSQVATELPPLTEMVESCEMGEQQRKVYESIRLAQWARVEQVLDNGRVRQGKALEVLEALLRLRQAACDPSLLPGGAGLGAPSTKLDRLESLLVELVVDDHKALVFSQWTSMLDRVEERLKQLGIDWVRLDGSTRDRASVIDRFQDPDGPPVFLLSLKAGGTGLNLTAADYVVHLDPWWNPAVEQQATDRAHRIGQDKPVVSIKLVAEGTVEERILKLQDAKRDLAEAALGADGGVLRSLSGDELRALFDH